MGSSDLMPLSQRKTKRYCKPDAELGDCQSAGNKGIRWFPILHQSRWRSAHLSILTQHQNEESTKIKIAFDIDCVLSDFEKEFCRRFGWKNRHFYRLQERYPNRTDEITKFIENPKTYAELSVEPLALAYFKFMQKTDEVYIATARPNNCFDVTVKWLEENDIHPIELLFSYTDKVKLMKDVGIDVMIDDSPSQLKQAEEAGIFVICWSQPWNIWIYPRLVPIQKNCWQCTH